jgi:hypothetical protein
VRRIGTSRRVWCYLAAGMGLVLAFSQGAQAAGAPAIPGAPPAAAAQTAPVAADPVAAPVIDPTGAVIGSAQRRTVSGGDAFHLRLSAGPVELPADNGSAWVLGRGYDADQGIFLAFCVIPDSVTVGDPSTYTELPTPCLAGREAKDGSSRRITNSDTGTPGITIPYGPRGSFLTSLTIRREISDGVVCDVTVRCAIVTRGDHTATQSRAYDQYIPVRFTG